jgi:hypothetical protein
MENNAYVGMYSVDQNSILLTLFTKDGNQPRLRAPAESSGDTIDFSFVDISNLKPKQGYINGLSIKFIDRNKIVETWSWHQDGSDYKFSFEMKRKG